MGALGEAMDKRADKRRYIYNTRTSYPEGSREKNRDGGVTTPSKYYEKWATLVADLSPTARLVGREEPLEAPNPAACFPLAPLDDPSVVLFLGPGGRVVAEEPPVARLWVLFGG